MVEDISEKRKKIAKQLEVKMKNESLRTKNFREIREQASYAKNDIKKQDLTLILDLGIDDIVKKYSLEISHDTPLKSPMGAKDAIRSMATADEYCRKGKIREAAAALMLTASNYDKGMRFKSSFLGQRNPKTGNFEEFIPPYRNLEPGEDPVKIFESLERRAVRYASHLGSKDPAMTKALLMLAEQIEKKIEPYRKK